MRREATTWPRAVVATLAGALVCCVFIAGIFVQRYWGAFGVFAAYDWLELWPTIRAVMLDYLFGLAFGIGLWAVFRAERLGGLALASAVGAFAMVVEPRINAIIYMTLSQIPIDWMLTLQIAVRGAVVPLFAGAIAGAVMWRIAYGGAARLAGADTSRGTA